MTSEQTNITHDSNACELAGMVIEHRDCKAPTKRRHMRLEFKAEVDTTPQMIAQLWWAMDDDAQAKFFCAVAALSEAEGGVDTQGYYIGSHLATCKCATQEGRDLIDAIYAQMHSTDQPHGEAHQA